MSDEKKYDDASSATGAGSGPHTIPISAATMVGPVFADERGFHEKGHGHDGVGEKVVVGALDPHSPEGAVQRNLKGRHLAMVSRPQASERYTRGGSK